MEINGMIAKTKKALFRFRFPILVVVIGLVLLTFPGKSKVSSSVATEPITPTAQQNSTTQQLTEILQQIKGVGNVKVLLTISKGEKKEYQTDEDLSTDENGGDIRKETVIIRDADDNETALLTQIIAPEYLGAIVVCEGADDVNVKLAVLEAVSKATGLRSDSISVLKMK
jgi:stage III sporulation protein AG